VGIKKLDYEQIRDSKAVSEANSRTREIYGELTTAGSNGERNAELYTGSAKNIGNNHEKPNATDSDGREDVTDRERSLETDQDALVADDRTTIDSHRGFDGFNVQISNDEDDSYYRRKSRRSGR
jgi:hypothetical protein